MKKLISQLTLYSFLFTFIPASAHAETRFRRWSLFGGGGAAAFRIAEKTTIQARPHLGIEVAFPFGLTLGNDFHYVQAPFGPGQVKQSALAFRVGWHFLERALQLVGRYDVMSTKFSNYETGSHGGFGVEALYRLPLSENERFFLNLGGGWSYVEQVTVRRDTGVPISSSSFTNALCDIFSLGLSSNGCGNVFESVTVPKNSYWNLGAAVAWVW